MHLYQLIKDIKSMKIQGANSIAVHSLKFLKNYPKIDKKFFQDADKLLKARPTAVVLYNCIQKIKKSRNKKTIEKLLSQLKGSNKKIANYGSKYIQHNKIILTHCHSTEALSLIQLLNPKHVYATETLPHRQGLITIDELRAKKIPSTLIRDEKVKDYIPIIDYVIVGSDALRKNGIINKFHTKDIAQLAKKYKKPFYVAANLLKIDKRKTFKIEKAKIKNMKMPLFDLTDWKYMTRIITDKGVFTPCNLRKLIC